MLPFWCCCPPPTLFHLIVLGCNFAFFIYLQDATKYINLLLECFSRSIRKESFLEMPPCTGDSLSLKWHYRSTWNLLQDDWKRRIREETTPFGSDSKAAKTTVNFICDTPSGLWVTQKQHHFPPTPLHWLPHDQLWNKTHLSSKQSQTKQNLCQRSVGSIIFYSILKYYGSKSCSIPNLFTQIWKLKLRPALNESSQSAVLWKSSGGKISRMGLTLCFVVCETLQGLRMSVRGSGMASGRQCPQAVEETCCGPISGWSPPLVANGGLQKQVDLNYQKLQPPWLTARDSGNCWPET